MADGGFKDLAKRTVSYKVLTDKAFNIIENPKHDGYKRGLASMVYEFLDKTSGGRAVTMPAKNNSKQHLQLAEELDKPIIRNFQKRIVYSIFGMLI